MDRFVMLYSCGKDSTMALDRMLGDGHLPVAMIVAFGEKGTLSYMHAVEREMVENYSVSFGISLLPIFGKREDKTALFTEAIRKARDEYGATAVCFGDIFQEWSREWGESVCRSLGMKAYYPLWHIDTKAMMYELVEKGYKCMFKSLNRNLLPKELLGRFLDKDVISQLEAAQGVDICGEKGEYHTVVLDGPIFKFPIPYQTGKVVDLSTEFSVLLISTPEQKQIL